MNIPFLRNDAPGRREVQDVQTPVADEAVVCGRRDGEPGVEEGRVFDGVAIEAAGEELEHLSLVLVG